MDEKKESEKTRVPEIKPIGDEERGEDEKNKKKTFVIKRDTLIIDIVQNYPELAENLMAAGFHCVGCPASAYESIYEGSVVHGATDAMIDELIDSMNKRIQEIEAKKG